LVGCHVWHAAGHRIDRHSGTPRPVCGGACKRAEPDPAKPGPVWSGHKQRAALHSFLIEGAGVSWVAGALQDDARVSACDHQTAVPGKVEREGAVGQALSSSGQVQEHALPVSDGRDGVVAPGTHPMGAASRKFRRSSRPSYASPNGGDLSAVRAQLSERPRA